MTAKVDGISVAAGNAKLMKRLGISYQECHHVGTVIHMAVDGKYEGHILISDILKPHAKEAIAELKKAGIKKTVMLTGDSKRVADQVAKELGIGEVYSELLPADKVSKVEELLHQKSEKRSLHLWVTVSMMRRYCPEQILVLLWVHWVLMQRLKQQISY